MKRVLFGMMAFLAGMALIASPVASQPPGGKDGKAKDGKGKGTLGAVKLGTALPPALVEELKLTDEQKSKLAEIEKTLKGELDTLLTDEQKKTVEHYRSAGSGAKGAGPGDKGGKALPPPAAGKPNSPAEQAPAPTEKGKSNEQTGLFKEAATIQWYATLSRGLAEAKRTGRPILFVSGNPSCSGVSGMWCPGKGIIDRVYLSRPEVIAAASKFVCIRLTAYEDETERLFMSQLVRGDVSNTSFNILSPDGKPLLQLQGTGKGPGEYFKDAQDMAKGMDAISAKYSIKSAAATPALPVALDAKVGLVIAAADNQPIVLVLAENPN